MDSSVIIPRSAVARIYRCGLFGTRVLLVMIPESGLSTTMVSWRVVKLRGAGPEVARASLRQCRAMMLVPAEAQLDLRGDPDE